MPLNVAVAGLGWVATARHIPTILRNKDCQIVGVIDREAAKAAAVARKFNLSNHAASTSLHDVPWLDQVDAVTIGAPPFAHHDLACAALNLGKHVLTEKPFAMTTAEGKAMCDTATAAQKVLAVVHNFQFARATTRLENDLSAGKLGDVRWIAAQQLGNPRRRLPNWYQTLPLGLFYDESPHFYYLLRRLAGDLELKDAIAWQKDKIGKTPDQIRLVYDGTNNIPVTISCNFVSPLSEWTIMVGGTEALGIVDIFRDFYVRLPQDGAHGLPQIIGTSLRATLQHWAQYIPNGIAFLRGQLDYGNEEVVRRFVAATATGLPPPGISATDAQAVLNLQQQVIEKLRWL